ncbi:hypothetical protein GWK47_014579 [Chionoecetes opilio]|uniref:Uncharacterized protein n=1 Tax=Chionoecetes opilio TaxID=41210 RepID=A0A8J5CIQ6_CHIOP|nr:hypothetical protein GWK47_014579 [Chionoecetes opilio]
MQSCKGPSILGLMRLAPTVNILGVEVNSTLSFTSHVRKTASKAAGRLNCVRRVSHLLDARGVTTLYAAQVRSLMDPYSTGETWPACASRTNPQQGAPHLAILRQPWATPHPYSTRDANKRDQQLIVPFARTATFFRSFLPRYSRLWNRVVRQTDMHQAATLHIFKCAVNAWLMPSGHN